ncbi:hypothetical protein RhiirC2_790296 [Rhizophagus irregularis]|uniref:Uncharacterized protein n=1 Tax=Rhizophagus irregularis TaxID=588596 RepID=A0A2N1MLH3_9GLOM|nr:hypothetical protein RhiirC2_790296 [Rhizophagus irregularis]
MRTWVQKLGDAYMHWFSGNWMLQDCKDREHHQTTLSLPKGASEKDLLEHEFDRTGYFPSIVSRLGIIQGVHKRNHNLLGSYATNKRPNPRIKALRNLKTIRHNS